MQNPSCDLNPETEELSSYCTEENLLGSGGYGEVYCGWFTRKGVRKEVAIKRDKAKNDIEVEQHLTLRNPNVLRWYNFVRPDLKCRYHDFILILGVQFFELAVSYIIFIQRFIVLKLTTGTMTDLFHDKGDCTKSAE